jgi:hypothetical protein
MRRYSDFAHAMRDIYAPKRIQHAKECIASKWGELTVREINFLMRYVRIFGKAA